MRTDLQCPFCGSVKIIYHAEDAEMVEFYMCWHCHIDAESCEVCAWLRWHDDGRYYDSYTGKEMVFVDVRTGEKVLFGQEADTPLGKWEGVAPEPAEPLTDDDLRYRGEL